MMRSRAEQRVTHLGPCLVGYCKVFETVSLHICNIKHRLITKLITELVYKLRDESNEPKQPAISAYDCSDYCSNLVSNHDLIRLIRFVS